jgi:hypothetical protein
MSGPPHMHVLIPSIAAKKESLFNISVNSGEMLGIGWLPGTIGGGIRNSSANYLMESKSNLDILTGAQVTKVLFSEASEPTAIGVEYTSGPSGERSEVYICMHN